MDTLARAPNHYNLQHFQTALIQPVLTLNIQNFEWQLIFRRYLQQKTFLAKILQIASVVDYYNCQIDHFIFFLTFSEGYNLIGQNPEGL